VCECVLGTRNSCQLSSRLSFKVERSDWADVGHEFVRAFSTALRPRRNTMSVHSGKSLRRRQRKFLRPALVAAAFCLWSPWADPAAAAAAAKCHARAQCSFVTSDRARLAKPSSQARASRRTGAGNTTDFPFCFHSGRVRPVGRACVPWASDGAARSENR
jgi:hypothetical protein